MRGFVLSLSRLFSVLVILAISVVLSACNLMLGQAAAQSSISQSAAQSTYGPVVPGGNPEPTKASNDQAATASTAVPTTAPTVAPTTASSQAAPTKPLPTLDRNRMGVQAYGYLGPNEWGVMIERAYNMGFKLFKLQLSWKELEPSKGQFSPQFEVLRQVVFDTGKARGERFMVLLSVAKAPDWARPAEARGNNDGPPANPQDLVDFINVVLQRFELAHVMGFEIWNEPNALADWTGAPFTAQAYLNIFNPAYNAIRAVSKDMIVVSGAPTPTGDNDGAIDDRKWLQNLYAAGLPISDPNFVIGAHPYGWANPPDARCCPTEIKGWDDHPTFFFLDTLYDYRNIMVNNNHAQGKIWVTEFGWSSFEGLRVGSHEPSAPPAVPPNDPGLAWMSVLTEQQQAEYIVRAFELAQTTDLANFVGPMFLWNLNFSTLPDFVTSDKPSRSEAGFSVLHSNTFPRKAFYLLGDSTKK